MGLASCQQETPDFTQIQEGVTLQEGMLQFASIEGYEAFVAEDPTNQLAALKANGFNTLGERLIDASEAEQALTGFTLGQDFLAFSLINEAGLISIGEWVTKIDMARGVVGVAEAANPKAVAALVNGEVSAADLRWFSTADEVLTLLEEDQASTMSAMEVETLMGTSFDALWDCEKAVVLEENVCNLFSGLVENSSTKKTHYEEYQCGDYDSNTGEERCNFWLADAKHTYQLAGVYFSLQSKIKYRGNAYCSNQGPLAVNTDLTLSVSYYYEKKRRFRSNEVRSGSHSNSIYGNELSHRSYEGTRGLAAYRLDTSFTYRRKDDCSTNHNCLPGSGTVRSIVLPRISG